MASRVPLSPALITGHLVEHEGKTYQTIREGKAYILIPPYTQTSVDPKAKAKGEGGETPQNVFYNPVQQFNRDLSVLAIKAYAEILCERRRQKHDRDSVKQQAKKERKKKAKAEAREGGDSERQVDVNPRKRGAETQERDHNEDKERAKLHRTESGSASPAAEGSDNDAQELHTAEGAPEEGNVPYGEQANGTDAPQLAETTVAPVATTDTVHAAPAVQPPNQSVKETQAAGPVEQPEWKPGLRILDALSASGLRALRYASEIPAATAVTANDMDRNAVKSIRINAAHNKLTDKIEVNLGNAIGYMYGAAYPPTDSHGPRHISRKYDVIDLDPYGTAAPFIDAALQALNDGGLLCVTCTDSGVFASCGYAEKTYALYGGMPLKGYHSHEGGLRLIINSVATAAAKYGLAVEPLLSLSIDFYARIFIRVAKSPADVKFLAGKTMVVYNCDNGCGAWDTQMLARNLKQTDKAGAKVQQKTPMFSYKHSATQAPSVDRLCEHCSSKMHLAGPMWGGPLHNAAFVDKVLSDARSADSDVYQTKQRLEGMLDTALEELIVVQDAENLWRSTKRGDDAKEVLPKTPPNAVDLHPFFVIPSALAKIIHCVAPSEAAVKGALRHAGYRATRSHCKPGSIKTDAPWSAIWEVMREWVRQRQPIRDGALKEGQPGWRIMRNVRKPEELANGLKDESENDAAAVEKDTTSSDSVDNVTETKHSPRAETPAKPERMKVVFDEVLGKDKPGKRLVRYQQNPRENWGPMARAKGSG